MEQYISQANTIDFIVFFAVIIYITVRRLRPRKFRPTRMYIWPVIYVLLVIFFATEINDPLMYLALLILGILGYLLGNKFLENGEIEFFYNSGRLYYKWPYSITILWSILFLTRIFLEFIGEGNILLLSIVDFLLSLNTGLLVSASFKTIKEAKRYRYI
ncbi:hypothetical protein [Acidianus brierleyi]|uniref:DUF1453 domain-containing protein n=1 Tax=Acidianus brierleyi TaxID=41673 RepID=A0A2U9IGP1_9CREN|nr:hypothetical protein [Acidianus brierleyi]AWR95135.1 hypothetical protein DFR85_11545 [Acidianus brierleyi]